ncbi:MAG: glycosyltransferase [Bacteroidia bacterium]|nr:glycosyltransferase [Bacteroidia bacterium]
MTIYSQVPYLQKQRFLPRQIDLPPADGLAMVIVIPCLAEPDLIGTLASLEACEPISSPVEVLIVINSSPITPVEELMLNEETKTAVKAWKKGKSLRYHVIDTGALPRNHAGVGLARKAGMDEAVDRLAQAGTHDGLIVCLDADCRVAPNYLQALSALPQNKKAHAWSIHVEHQEAGEHLSEAYLQAASKYELFQRYYVEGLRFAGYPMAFHTYGSAMAVRSSAYQAQGGMNRRKAGEDFYFLHKYSLLGTLAECNSTTVFPSARASSRVPFGTGKSIQQYLDRADGSWESYPLSVFSEIKNFLSQAEEFRTSWPEGLSPAVEAFLAQEDLPTKLADMRQHGTTPDTFRKRWFAWLDALKMLRMVHFLRDQLGGDKDLMASAGELRSLIDPAADEPDLLAWYRHWQTSR